MKGHVFSILVLAAMASPAVALEARVTKEASGSAAQVWEAVGGFCGISTWHPGIAKCEVSEANGVTFRTLTTKDGGKLLEKQTDFDATKMTYSYTIEESPLPVANYKSTFNVVAKENGAAIDWTGTFDAKDKPDAEVVKLITGVYEAGVDALVAKASK
jgi:hypothetical protein